MEPYYQTDGVTLYCGDCREVMAALDPEFISAVVCDPPYALTSASRKGSPRKNNPGTPHGRTKLGGDRGFMGKTWDNGRVAFDPATWAVVLECVKPGAHLLAFGGTRTYHRLACAIEDAGFDCRDAIMWHYGNGFPKSTDISKAIDKANGAKRERIRGVRSGVVANTFAQDAWSKEFKDSVLSSEPITDEASTWNGWGTALKPATEIVCVARAPLSEKTVAANMLKHGTGALNVDGCRVAGDKAGGSGQPPLKFNGDNHRPFHDDAQPRVFDRSLGRWPANVIHDGSDEVLAEFAKAGETISRASPANNKPCGRKGAVLELSQWENWHTSGAHHGDSGTAARFFYCAKASRRERGEMNNHPTVKPLALMRYLCRLVAPPGGVVLDPFAGSGSTLLAARVEGFRAIGIEQSEEYCDIIVRRLERQAEAVA